VTRASSLIFVETFRPTSEAAPRRVSPTPELPDDVRRFLLSSIPSIPYLEAVLLFQRLDGAGLTTLETARALYVDDAVAAELMAQLARNGIVVPSGERWLYAPRDERLTQMLRGVALAYRRDLVGVTGLIHRRTGAERFADAFRLRKER
jgi:hypothetical protein